MAAMAEETSQRVCGHPMKVTGEPPIEMYECTRLGCPGGDPVEFGEVDPV